jgi:hypothetical protein
MNYTSQNEILGRIHWLEAEIDTCLSCDLPIEHLEQELSTLSTKTNVNNQNYSPPVLVGNLE